MRSPFFSSAADGSPYRSPATTRSTAALLLSRARVPRAHRMYFRTIVSLLRLPCKRVYVERYLSGAMHHGPVMVREAEFGPARVIRQPSPSAAFSAVYTGE